MLETMTNKEQQDPFRDVQEPFAASEGTSAAGAGGEPLVATLEQIAQTNTPERWDLATKRTVLVIMLIAGIYIIYISRSILPIVLSAGIISYLLSPAVNLASRLKIPRLLSSLVVYLVVILGLLLLPIIFVPALIDQLRTLANFDVPGTARSVLNWLDATIRSLPAQIVLLGYAIPLSEFVGRLQANTQQVQFIPSVNDILNYIQNLLSTTTTVVGGTFNIGVSVVGGIFSGFLTALVIFFLSLYMTIDAPRIRAYIHDLFPPSYRSELADLLRRIGSVWQAFLRGQLILSVTVGLATYLALGLVGMPGALIFAILAGLLEVVPNLGPIMAMIPAVIMAMIQGSEVMRELGFNNLGFALITVGIYFLIQQLENNILVPRIIGDSINLHPIAVICAVAVGLTTAGILGALLAPPVTASFRVLGSYVHAKLLDYPPFVGRAAVPKPPRSYRRTLSKRELEARRAAPQTAAPQTAAPQTAAPQTLATGDPESPLLRVAESGHGEEKRPLLPREGNL